MASSPIYLGRQPILDRQGQLHGYELLFRCAQSPDRALVLDDSAATATVITNAFSELSLGNALDGRKMFINVGEELLFSEAVEFLPTAQVVLEILETIEVTPAVVERCKALKARGFALALDDLLEITPANQPLLSLADIIKVPLLHDWENQAALLAHQLQAYPVQLLAERVETLDQYRKCAALGYQLFQGYFFARPALLQGRKLNQDRLTLVILLNQILDDADTPVLERTFKTAPGLSVNLLRLTNSVAAGCHAQIASLRHAITLLGRKQLQRWLQLLLFSGPHTQNLARNPLLQLAATRARLMETLMLAQTPPDRSLADQAFMVGIMSLTPALLEMSMEEILTQLSNLPPLVREAL
ncbi:MAG: EAL domain-containing protein, partial [Azovibrio sp.]|nr:EAL domain-containing protein [Azovibrio sp.]